MTVSSTTMPSTPEHSAMVTQITHSVWRVIVPDSLVYLTPPPPRAARYLVGRVEWLSSAQRFRVILDEVRIEEADGQTLSLPVYLQPGTAEVVREILALTWMRHYTEPGLYSNALSQISGYVGGHAGTPNAGGSDSAGGSGGAGAPPAVLGALDPSRRANPAGDSSGGSQTPRTPRKRMAIRSPLSPLVSPRAAEQARALDELDRLIESLEDTADAGGDDGNQAAEQGEK